ncbi:hypothetical protein [Paenibacillus terrigena]|uniref:hypothetical protein n=1 Tax=Paenibacillus terrigena TaxID=369333 RepID=UPI00036A4CAB|nr:hypothetical protein [Paenibacillus terrigena]
MCGILFSGTGNKGKENFLNALKLIVHRGPDAPLGFYQHEDYMLGHNRLSIIDINERSNQPFFSKDRRYIIVYNGEIYNFRELAKQHSINMVTESDTELLLEMYIKFGSRMLNWLNGMFSFVILDTYKSWRIRSMHSYLKICIRKRCFF